LAASVLDRSWSSAALFLLGRSWSQPLRSVPSARNPSSPLLGPLRVGHPRIGTLGLNLPAQTTWVGPLGSDLLARTTRLGPLASDPPPLGPLGSAPLHWTSSARAHRIGLLGSASSDLSPRLGPLGSAPLHRTPSARAHRIGLLGWAQFNSAHAQARPGSSLSDPPHFSRWHFHFSRSYLCYLKFIHCMLGVTRRCQALCVQLFPALGLWHWALLSHSSPQPLWSSAASVLGSSGPCSEELNRSGARPACVCTHVVVHACC